ncbi:hypothetical protein [Geodermatophilus sabuli]|uniref:NTP pyrophosphohydrolase n=1 Tax=Geodermatophilus sabuli TaxID=1564158 RepID=A0A285EBJ0_9ACTN|nr:hypothetical protein [Geodermatophilus sabuli]MBB3085349.1 hypothetical protein [Geodermatophilus sabuli]SNX96223.1 hypothetical protein SAMN06893097_103392 [Geodermatophilus sabuli]
MTVVLVDVANMLGARPDGWWRDRAGATTRLLRRLAPLAGRLVRAPEGGTLLCRELVVVVEGAARDVRVPDGVTVVRARGSGDDALAARAAALAADDVAMLVVTADRGLRSRLPAGTPVTGPGWLYRVLPDAPA